MGDRGKLYVPEQLVEVYREEMLSLATILTPNQFEIQLLTGTCTYCWPLLFAAAGCWFAVDACGLG